MKTDTFDNSIFFNETGDSKHADPEAETTQHYSTSNGTVKLSDPQDPLLFESETKTPRIYKCRHCDFCTPSNRDLKYHFLTHRKNAAVYECKFCSFVTNHSNVRDAHKLTHMKEDAIFWHECGTCTFRSKFKANLDKHELIHKVSHEQKRFKCEHCSYRSMWKRDLERHEIVHKKPGEIPLHHCQYCFFRTKHQRYLKSHIQKVHIGEEYPPDQIFHCAHCSFSTRLKKSLKGHMILHREREMILHCNYCTYVTDTRDCLKKHMVKHTKIFKCDQCDFSTNLKRFLRQHILAHNPIDQPIIYNCAKCSFQTTYKHSIVNHRLVHKNPGETEMFSCQYCDYKSKRRSDVRGHVIAIHTESLPWKHCPECNYRTRYNYTLKLHVKFLHSTEKAVTFNCKFCRFTTKYKYHVKIHERICDRKPGTRKRVICEECGFETKSIDLLKRHMVIHKSLDEIKVFKCGYCYKFETRYRRSLVLHIRRHRPELKEEKEEKWFECNECSFKTKRECYLDKHMSKHFDFVDTGVTKCHIDEALAKPTNTIKNELMKGDSNRSLLPSKIEDIELMGDCLEKSKSQLIGERKIELTKNDYNENNEIIPDDIKLEPTVTQM